MNTRLWEKFARQRKEIARDAGEDPRVLTLYHGTSGNDPKELYEGIYGMDYRLSRKGMWGHGSYFAVNAS